MDAAPFVAARGQASALGFGAVACAAFGFTTVGFVTAGFGWATAFGAGSPGPTIVKPSDWSTLFVSSPPENSWGRSSRPVACEAASEITYFGG